MPGPVILIAEDDIFLSKIYQTKMSKVGLVVVLAKDGEEVFTLLKDNKPKLILLDIIMPKKDGFTVLQELKANKDFADIPVLITSNLGQPEDRQKALQLGALDYIVKSGTSIQEIVTRVQELTKEQPQAPAAPAA
jgi:DNA-binding response OmpR family regulator